MMASGKRLINADRAELYDAIGRNAFRDRQDIIDLINNQPTADVVEVVRCRNCKYSDWDSKPDDAMVCMRTKGR